MNAFSEVLAPWLADYLLLSTLLLAVVLVLCRRIGQPAQRLAIARPTLAALFLLIGLCALPGWSLVHLMTTAETARDLQGMSDIRPAPPIEHSAAQLVPTPNFDLPTSSPMPTTDPPALSAPALKPFAWTTWLVGAYLFGCLLTIAWQASGGVLARRLIRDATPAPPELQTLLAEIGEDAKRIPKLLVSARIHTPAALGVLHPTILLPQEMLARQQDSLRPILAHEWAHIRHGDLRTLAAVRVLMILLWPQPLYWLLRRQIRRDQETLADAVAADVTSRADFAEQLIAWARIATEARTPWLAASVGLWESASQLKQRVAMLLDERLTVLRSCSRRWRIASAISLTIVAVALSLVTLTPADTLVAEVESEQNEKTEITPAPVLGGLDDPSEGWTLLPASPISPVTSPVLEPDVIEAPDEEVQQGEYYLRIGIPPADADSGEKSTAESTVKPTAAATAKERQQALNKLQIHLYENKKPNTFQAVCLDENWQPLAGVEVEVYLDDRDAAKEHGRPIRVAKSNRRGEVDLSNVIDLKKEFPEGLPAGQFFSRKSKLIRFVGRAEGRVSNYDADYVSEIAKTGKARFWIYRPASTLRGRVTDPAGQPVVGARVMTGAAGALVGNVGGIHSATTDANGEYDIADLDAFDAEQSRRAMAEMMKGDPKTMYTVYSSTDPRGALFVKHPKFATRRAAIEKIPGKVDVQLAPASTIEGRITLPAGEARQNSVVGTAVHLQRVVPLPKPGEYPDPFSFQIETARVDPSGRYQFTSLPAGKYHLTADVEGWVTQGVEDVEVTTGETAIAPDIFLFSGGRVRVQLVDDETGEPFRFESPVKGYVNPQPRPQRAPIFAFRNNIVEYSREGNCEIQLAVGKYALSVTIPQPDRSYIVSALPKDMEKWPTMEVKEGELIEVPARVKMWKQPQIGTGTFRAAAPVSEESEDDAAETTFVPETPPAESEDK